MGSSYNVQSFLKIYINNILSIKKRKNDKNPQKNKKKELGEERIAIPPQGTNCGGK